MVGIAALGILIFGCKCVEIHGDATRLYINGVKEKDGMDGVVENDTMLC